MAKSDGMLALFKKFPTEEACIKHLESLRWPTGIICPLCGESRKFYPVTRGNLYKCADCKKQFSVRKGTIFEESRLPLQTWFAAAWLVTSNRKGIASTQLARELDVTQKTAWFMLGRLREVASAIGDLGGPLDQIVEADETYMGGKEKNKHADKKLHAGRGATGKQPVIGAVERGGRVKTQLISGPNTPEVHGFIRGNVTPGATLYTDEHRSYNGLVEYRRGTVNHGGGQYVSGDVWTNGIESFWSLLKRGHYGIFHYMSRKHLHRYLAEFETRWSMVDLNCHERVDAMLENAFGLRLTYKALTA